MQRLGWRMNHEPNIYGTDGDASKGAAVYTPLALALYDLAVLRISNSFVWECDSHVLLDFYPSISLISIWISVWELVTFSINAGSRPPPRR